MIGLSAGMLPSGFTRRTLPLSEFGSCASDGVPVSPIVIQRCFVASNRMRQPSWLPPERIPVRMTNPSSVHTVPVSWYRRTWFTTPPAGWSLRVAQTYTKRFVANAGSTAMPMSPLSPFWTTLATVSVASFRAPDAPLSKTCTVPPRSVTSIRPSGAKAISHGMTRFAWTTWSVSRGTNVGGGCHVAATSAWPSGATVEVAVALVAGAGVSRLVAGGEAHADTQRATRPIAARRIAPVSALARLRPWLSSSHASRPTVASPSLKPARLEQRDLAAVTRRGMEELGRRFDRAKPEVAIVLTPHNIHVEGAMAVVTSGTVSGALEGHPDVALRLPTDRALALAIRDAIAAEGIPVAGVSYGANDADRATFPMDWAVLVPLWFMGGRSDPPVRTVVIAPARDLPYERHVAAGRAIETGRRRVGKARRAHRELRPRARPRRERPVRLHAEVRGSSTSRWSRSSRTMTSAGLLRMDPTLPAEGKADSYWQMLMLHGALGGKWRGEFLSYEAPTYFGMLCAAYQPVR